MEGDSSDADTANERNKVYIEAGLTRRTGLGVPFCLFLSKTKKEWYINKWTVNRSVTSL